jgi:hypothetical protein
MGLLISVARNRIKFIETAIRSWQNRSDDLRPENDPFFLERRVPGRKSVIAVANCGFPSRLPWRILVSPFTAFGI